MKPTITLDGRNFLGPSQSCIANQAEYVVDQLRLAGVIELAANDLAGATRAKERVAYDVMTEIMLSGRTSYILAGCLTEEGKTWSCADADANAARFDAITDPSEKAARQRYLVEFVSSFFTSAVFSRRIH
jgi:hypothetical protein